MSHSKILDKTRAALVVVDLQEAFRSAISDFPMIASQAAIAVRGFLILELPVIVTEQYPKGLGRSADEILFSLPDDFEVVEKSTFSSCGAVTFLEKLRADNISQIVLCGLETHICVNQTAHDLLNEDFEVHILQDAVGSRFDHDKTTALQKMRMNGVVPSTVEMSLFELLKDSKHEKFKEVQNLIK